MEFNNLTNSLQNILMVSYYQDIKLFLLFGLFFVSLFYVFYVYENQKKTKFLFVSTIRFIFYVLTYFYMWVFFLIFPLLYHPAVPIDNLLIFLTSFYLIVFTIFTIMFVVNGTSYMLRAIVNFGKFDIDNAENKVIKNHIDKIFKK